MPLQVKHRLHQAAAVQQQQAQQGQREAQMAAAPGEQPPSAKASPGASV